MHLKSWKLLTKQGPGEERLVIGVVHQARHDPVDAPPTPARRDGRRVLLPRVGLTLLMGQTLRGYPVTFSIQA